MKNSIKLFSNQVRNIEAFLEFAHIGMEDALLARYQAYTIEELNASDYDEIIEFLQEKHSIDKTL